MDDHHHGGIKKMGIISKPIYYTGKLSGYVNVACVKVKDGFAALGHKMNSVTIRSVSPKIKVQRTSLRDTFFSKTVKPSKNNIRIRYLAHHPLSVVDPENREFYSNVGRDLVESIKKDGDNDCLTVLDISKYENPAQ